MWWWAPACSRRRTWRQKEWNSMYFGLSTMICALTLWLGAQSPGWTGYPLSEQEAVVAKAQQRSRCVKALIAASRRPAAAARIFCTAAADRKLRLLTSDLQDRHEVKVMEGHTSYINHLVFEPTEGKQIASVSDDHTCRVWDLDGKESCTLRLRSPGVSVCWHPEEAFKLMVAEKKGTIRFYDLLTQQAILSLDCGQSPLLSADWCLTNTIKVGAAAGNDWLIWDITRSSYPQEKRPAHVDKARLFKWSRANENLFATTGCPGKISTQLLIHHLGHPQPVTVGSAAVGSGLSWHRTLPLCVVGGDRKLSFWMTEM
uniref:Nucleoporin Nup37 n=1 Tax=Gasterosteus aculeatus aculeatus TaxID=481459 RepID=A0AAQ4PXS7_GASAC